MRRVEFFCGQSDCRELHVPTYETASKFKLLSCDSGPVVQYLQLKVRQYLLHLRDLSQLAARRLPRAREAPSVHQSTVTLLPPQIT